MSGVETPPADLLKRRTAQLRSSEKRFRAMIEQNADGILIVDVEGHICYANPAARKLFGRDEIELKSYGIGMPSVALESCAVQLRRPDGSTCTAEMRVTPTEWEERTAQLVCLRDITERMQLEEQLRRAQRLEAIGLLAAGVAHDFNNLLTVIIGFGQMIAEAPEDAATARSLATEIVGAGNRASDLTRQLLAFGRRQILKPKVVELSRLVARLQLMLRGLLGDGVHFEMIFASQPCHVYADPCQLEQVVVNLVLNARDALTKRGRVTIQTALTELPRAHFGESFTGGRYVMLSVADNGHGMDPSTRDHIFDPFFSTKGPTRGHGLGLSTVYGTVKQSDGEIEVHSEPDAGTEFRIYLPAVAGCEEIVDELDEQPFEAYGRTALVVEDETGVRRMALTMLQSLGFNVLEANNGCDALRVAQEHAGVIDLLLTDVVMPRMGGADLAKCIRQLRPGIRVLYMSGYIDDQVLEHGVATSQVPFLQKPFTREQFTSAVRAALASARAAANLNR